MIREKLELSSYLGVVQRFSVLRADENAIAKKRKKKKEQMFNTKLAGTDSLIRQNQFSFPVNKK